MPPHPRTGGEHVISAAVIAGPESAISASHRSPRATRGFLCRRQARSVIAAEQGNPRASRAANDASRSSLLPSADRPTGATGDMGSSDAHRKSTVSSNPVLFWKSSVRDLFCGIKSSIAWTQLRKAKRRRNYHHPPANVPQTLGHLCLSGELGNQVLRTLNRFFPRVVSVMGSQRSHTLDEIRHDGTEQLQATANKPVLRNARWCLLKWPENLTDRQTTSLQEILKHNLKTLRAWPSREDFQRLMSVAEMLRRHKPLLLNWF